MQDKINILLVDDQPSKLMSYEAILAELGENLIAVTSAREALQTLLRSEIAVILMDVQMPEFDGFELAAMVREHPRFERTAIIFVSAIHLSEACGSDTQGCGESHCSYRSRCRRPAHNRKSPSCVITGIASGANDGCDS